MKPYLFALASCGALMLSGCKGSIGSPKQPAWADAQPCQKALPDPVDYTKDAPMGDQNSVVVVTNDGGQIMAYVVNPKDGTVGSAYKVNPADYAELSNPMGDRIAGAIIRPTPPPPPGGWDRLRNIVGLAGRISQTSGTCSGQPGGIIGPEKPGLTH
jgi:hypothetical protein